MIKLSHYDGYLKLSNANAKWQMANSLGRMKY